MRKRNMRGYVAGFALAAGLCITQGIPAHAATEVQSDSGTDQSYETADPSRGVTYIKNDSGNTLGINLNGNSAVIRMSENSTSDSIYAGWKCGYHLFRRNADLWSLSAEV